MDQTLARNYTLRSIATSHFLATFYDAGSRYMYSNAGIRAVTKAWESFQTKAQTKEKKTETETNHRFSSGPPASSGVPHPWPPKYVEMCRVMLTL